MKTDNDETGKVIQNSSLLKQYMELKKQEEEARQSILLLNEILDNEATRLLESAKSINMVLDTFLEYVDTIARKQSSEDSSNTFTSQHYDSIPLAEEDLKKEVEELRVIKELVELDYQKKKDALEDRDLAVQTITDMITLMTAKRYRFIGEIASLMDRITELEEETRIYYAILHLREQGSSSSVYQNTTFTQTRAF